MIVRPDYLNAIIPFMDTPLVKILSGVRRCGKSTILEMFSGLLAERGISGDHIIQRNYASSEFDSSFSAKEMYADLKAAISDKGRCYLLLDEVQEVSGWEKVINTLLESHDADIYVTGSNSKLMSGEISTYLTGRYVSIPVYTLSFREYLSFKSKEPTDAHRMFAEYLQYGGFPIIAISNFEPRSAYQIADGIYASVVTRDISKRHKIRSKELFDRVARYIVENVGKTFSANSIVSFLKNEKRTMSVETVYNYLKWLSDAFVIYPCRRYDIQGKTILKTQEKYYLSDISFKYTELGFDTKMIASLLENIVYLEMRRRGYETYIGKNGTKEIDFIGIRRNERIYVQVCRQLPENSEREIDNLLEIDDNYPKYVVTMDEMAFGNERGVYIVHIADFLLDDRW